MSGKIRLPGLGGFGGLGGSNDNNALQSIQSGSESKPEQSGSESKPEQSGSESKPEQSGSKPKSEQSGSKPKSEQSGSKPKSEQSGSKPKLSGSGYRFKKMVGISEQDQNIARATVYMNYDVYHKVRAKLTQEKDKKLTFVAFTELMTLACLHDVIDIEKITKELHRKGIIDIH